MSKCVTATFFITPCIYLGNVLEFTAQAVLGSTCVLRAEITSVYHNARILSFFKFGKYLTENYPPTAPHPACVHVCACVCITEDRAQDFAHLQQHLKLLILFFRGELTHVLAYLPGWSGAHCAPRLALNLQHSFFYRLLCAGITTPSFLIMPFCSVCGVVSCHRAWPVFTVSSSSCLWLSGVGIAGTGCHTRLPNSIHCSVYFLP